MKTLTLLVSIFFSAIASAQTPYNYPYTDPWAATVSEGLIRSPDGDPVKRRLLQIASLSGRATTPVLFRLYQQPAASSLVILIPGLGDKVDAAAPNYLADVFFRAGHHVLILPNDFTPEFADSASSSGVVGVPQIDAEDMRNLIRQVLNACIADEGLKFSTVKLIGYSLGALQSAFVSQQDETLAFNDKMKINITTTVLINSPVDLWHAITKLDQLGTLDNQISFETKAALDAMELDLLFKEWTVPEGDPNYFLTLNEYLPMPDVNLQYLIGSNFLKYLHYVDDSATSFQNYLQTVVLPTLASTSGIATTVQSLAEQQGLTSIASFLQQNHSVFILHNQDDFLLQASDLQFLNNTFGSRLILYPHGGHIGNLWYPQNQADMVRLLAD